MKKMIWSSDFDLEDIKDFIEEEYPDVTDEDEQYELFRQLNDEYLNDERINLNTDTNPIVCIADLGLWFGRRRGIKKLGTNLNSFLQSFMNGDVSLEFYGNGKNICGTEAHHDGVNYYTFREIKGDTAEQCERNLTALTNKILDGTFKNEHLSRYTRSIYKKVAAVYGW